VFSQLTEYVSGSPWTYVFIIAIAALDVLIPLLPSETSVILAGVLAASGDLVLPLVIVCAAVGAVLGDNAAYWLGHATTRGSSPWLLRGKRKQQLGWAERQLDERGGYLIVVARFIPAGRTLVTLACGVTRFAWRRFIRWDIVAGLLWATYAAGLGYLGGAAFEQQPWKGFIVAFAIALGVTGITEAVRYLRGRRSDAPA
jgi:membrane protein DedA with SNARE-associated domain